MNPIVQCKRIMGLFILISVISIFSIVPVKAAELKKCEDYLTNVKYINRYNVDIVEDENDSSYYVLTVEPTSSDSKLQAALRKIVFRVVKINGTAQDGSQTLTYQKQLKVKKQYVTAADGDEEMIVYLESTEKNADPQCTGIVKFHVGVTKGGESIIASEPIEPIKDEYGTTNGQAIDCTKEQSGSFEKNFCLAKNEAIKNDPDGSKGYNYDGKFNDEKFKEKRNFSDVVKDPSKYAKLRCSLDKFATKNDYYVNKAYFYGSRTQIQTFDRYEYHYSPGVVTEGANISCKTKCEESVVVEYGPPVASKAGLCFEYKVKVTSRVSCSMVEKPVPPETPSNYCTPTPLCKSSAHSSIVTNQGGPNEDFDQCIKECDGGKYTDKCSDKCYKKVYGKNKNSKTTLKKSSSKKVKYEEDAFGLDACIAESAYNGCYYRSGNDILWKGKSEGTPGRWYLVSPHKDLSGYGVFGNGIYRHIWSDGDHCHDICWWSGCSGNMYLNPGIAAKDRVNNKEKYDYAVAQCKATATCTTTKAEFTISVSYINGKKEEKWIDFPYSKQTDYLTSRGEKENIQDTSKNDNSTLLCTTGDESKDAEGDCERGCYSTEKAHRIYRAEWSFPGTWINKKTGEISFKNKTGNAWKSVEDKFCIPLDAQNVNEKWWNYRQGFDNEYKIEDSSVNSPGYEEMCINKGFGMNKVTKISEEDIEKWNINAKTNRFGYFEWNFYIECFYALNTNLNAVDNDSDSKDVPKECLSDSSYRIRSVDLNNLFPASDGSRAPGFNWSEYATKTKSNLDANNNYYTITPGDYASYVQKVGQGIYSDEHLDYSIDLSRSTIAKLREEKSDGNYANYDSDALDENYVLNYKSPLFGSSGILSNSVHPNSDSLKCNNMKNWNGGCEDFTGGVK